MSKKKYTLTQRTNKLASWIEGLQGQPAWDGLRECLEQIADGQDANKVFGLNRGRGRNAKQAKAGFKKKMVRVWAASAMREFQIKRPAAIEKAAEAFGMQYEATARYAQHLDSSLYSDGNFDLDELVPKT